MRVFVTLRIDEKRNNAQCIQHFKVPIQQVASGNVDYLVWNIAFLHLTVTYVKNELVELHCKAFNSSISTAMPHGRLNSC